MTKHTPGPWQADNEFVQWAGFWDVATIIKKGHDDDWRANARLIAAAPDLLEMGRKALQLAHVAADWNLSEVEIDGEMVSIYDLIEEYRAALDALTAEEVEG